MNLLINLTYHHRIDSECKYIDVILVTYVTHSAQPTQAKQEMVVVRHFRPMAANQLMTLCYNQTAERLESLAGAVDSCYRSRRRDYSENSNKLIRPAGLPAALSQHSIHKTVAV